MNLYGKQVRDLFIADGRAIPQRAMGLIGERTRLESDRRGGDSTVKLVKRPFIIEGKKEDVSPWEAIDSAERCLNRPGLGRYRG